LQLRDVARNAEDLVVESQRISPALEKELIGREGGLAMTNSMQALERFIRSKW
jgi:hypothetical protein